MTVNNSSQLNIREGTIAFWVKENKIQWGDFNVYKLFEISSNEGSVLVLKDNDNKLKFFHVYIGKGRTDIEYDVSSLSFSEPHHIAVTWSIGSKKAQLFLDGKLVAENSIRYSS